MKLGTRWLSIGSGKVNFRKKEKIPISLVLTRDQNYIEHIITFFVSLDPIDISERILYIVKSQKWYKKDVIQGIWTHGITIAGMGILKLVWLSQQFKVPVVSITDEPPDTQKIIDVLRSKIKDGSNRVKDLMENNVEPINIRDLLSDCNIWVGVVGMDLKEAIRHLNYQRRYSCLPEGLRIARLIATNVLTNNQV